MKISCGRRKRSFLAITLLSLIIFSGIVGQAGSIFSGRPNADPIFSSAYGGVGLGSYGWVEGSAYPGELNEQFNVTIQNLNNGTIYGIQEQINLTSTDMQNSTGGDLVNSLVAGQLRPGAVGTATFEISISSGGSSTQYTVPLTVNYNNATGNGFPSTQTMNIVIVISPPPSPVLGLALDSYGWASGSAIPGDINAQFNVTIQNLNSGIIYGVQEQINLTSTGMQNSTGGDLAISGVASINSGEFGSAIFDISVSSQATAGSHRVPLTIIYENATGSWRQTLYPVIVISTPLQLLFIGSTWTTSSGNPGGFQGDRNDTLNLQILNPNQFEVHILSSTISFNSTVLTGNAGGSAIDYSANPSTILPGESATLSFALNIASDAPIGLVPIEADVSYQDSYGASWSQNTQLPDSSCTNCVAIYGTAALAITQLTNTVQVQGDSILSLLVKNEGGSAMFAPSVVLNLPAGLLITANYTQPSTIPSIAAGSSGVFYFNVTASKSASLGQFSGTATIDYNDQFGTLRTTTFSLVVNVVGSIYLAVQSVKVTQTIQGITVSGSIQNLGTAPATLSELYVYLNKTGSLVPLGNATSYLGSIGAISTLSFKSVAIPFFAQNSAVPATITLRVVYQNSTDVTQEMSNVTSVLLLSSGSFSSAGFLTNVPQNILVISGIVLVAVVVSVSGFLFWRNRRRSVTLDSVSPEPQSKEFTNSIG